MHISPTAGTLYLWFLVRCISFRVAENQADIFGKLYGAFIVSSHQGLRHSAQIHRSINDVTIVLKKRYTGLISGVTFTVVCLLSNVGRREFYRIFKEIHRPSERYWIGGGQHSAQQLSAVTSPGFHIKLHAPLLRVCLRSPEETQLTSLRRWSNSLSKPLFRRTIVDYCFYPVACRCSWSVGVHIQVNLWRTTNKLRVNGHVSDESSTSATWHISESHLSFSCTADLRPHFVIQVQYVCAALVSGDRKQIKGSDKVL